jgi:hypothetical protein
MSASFLRQALLGVLVAIVVAAPARADTVTDWNALASSAVQGAPAQGGAGQGAVSIVHLAMVHGAMDDAVSAIEDCRRHRGSRGGSCWPPPWASEEAAAATAAYRVLTASTPPVGIPAGQGPVLADAYATTLAAVPDGPAKQAGIAVGEIAAAAMAVARADDGRFGPYRFPVGTRPGEWRPVLPAFVNDPGAWLKDVRPFVIPDPAWFSSRPPRPITSRAYARDFAEVKAVGSIDSTLRTEDQTAAARFWGTANATETIGTLLRSVAEARGGSLAANARMFAAAYAHGADALIVAWNDKAREPFWRPITAIREAASDGNPATEPDPEWLPLINNPPYPEHPSGLATLGGAVVRTLQDVLGTDEVAFGATSSTGVTRSYRRLSQMLDEIVDARVWSGIHFRFADEEGARLGRRVARWAGRHGWRDR